MFPSPRERGEGGGSWMRGQPYVGSRMRGISPLPK